MVPKKNQQERAWREWVASWERSGQSVQAFCRRHRIATWKMYAWRSKRLKAGTSADTMAAKPQGPRFVELSVSPGPGVRWGGEVELRNGRLLRFASDVPAGRVVELVAALEGNAC